jgi:tetratricopeptide (TPR) repeat protein
MYMIHLWTMEKINSRGLLARGLIYIAIFVFLPFLNISNTYAGKTPEVSDEAQGYRTKGYEAQQRGDIDTAIEWYQKAATIKPEYASPHNDLGILFETKGWLDRAEAEYGKALVIDPNYKEVHTNLALLYERKGELEKAAFHWMRRYKLGKPGDPWTQEAKSRLEKLGLLEKTENANPAKIEQKPPAVKEQQEKEKPAKAKPVKVKKKAPAPKVKAKKESGWTRVGSEKKKEAAKEPVKVSEPGRDMDKELQESLRLAEERLKKEKSGKEDIKEEAPKDEASSEINAAYAKAKDYYAKGEYTKALDVIRLAKDAQGDNKQLLELEDDIKFKMKEKRIEDHYKEGMIHYRQKDFAGARKEFEAILSILPE